MSSIHEAFLLQKHPMGHYVYTYNYKKALELLDNRADPDELNEDGMNILHLIGHLGMESMKKDIIQKHYKNLENDPVQDYFENMPLVLKKALTKMKGINVKLTDDFSHKKEPDWSYSWINFYQGHTPLHFAIDNYGEAFSNDKEIEKTAFARADLILESLLKVGADKTIKNKRGFDANGLFAFNVMAGQKRSFRKRIQRILDKY